MLNTLFATCGLLLGTLLVLGFVVGTVWLAASVGGVLGWAIAIFVVVGAVAG